jgi:protein-tyrosine phosphatase
MTPLADTHVHLLAGRDDGPRSLNEAVAMCRMLVAEGVRHATALAHQNEDYPENRADELRSAASELVKELAARQIPLSIYPTGEVMLSPSIVEDWQAGHLLSVGDRSRWLLVEMPHGMFVDVLPFVERLRPLGIRIILAHAERYAELLDDPAMAARWIEAGCLIQVTAQALAQPRDREFESNLQRWVTGGFVHLLGSDGHGIDRRRPELAAGFEQLVRWSGRAAAERIASHWGIAVLQGLALKVPAPRPPSRSWFTRLFGK